MLNQVVIVGRIKEIKEDILLINVSRSIRNEKGEYDCDTIKVKLRKYLLDSPYSINMLIGVKGRLECFESEEMLVNAEKITYLAHKEEE